MGLVSMILELRERDGSDISAPLIAPEDQMLKGIRTKPATPDGIRIQEAISLRTFAMRIDKSKRRAHKPG